MISFAHANQQCTGSIMNVEMIPANRDEEGVFTLNIIAQSQKAERSSDGIRTHAKFDGEEAFINLNANQATHLLFVLEGKADTINNGKGLFENGDVYTSILHCDRLKEFPRGCAFHIITKLSNNRTQNGRIILNPTEVKTLEKALNSSMDRVAFGD